MQQVNWNATFEPSWNFHVSSNELCFTWPATPSTQMTSQHTGGDDVSRADMWKQIENFLLKNGKLSFEKEGITDHLNYYLSHNSLFVDVFLCSRAQYMTWIGIAARVRSKEAYKCKRCLALEPGLIRPYTQHVPTYRSVVSTMILRNMVSSRT